MGSLIQHAQLKTLSLWGTTFESILSPPPQANPLFAHCAAVECLDIFDDLQSGVEITTEVIASITAPALRSLIYGYEDQSDENTIVECPSEQFKGLIARSGCNLDTLSLDPVWMTDASLISLLQACPNLSSLTVAGCAKGENPKGPLLSDKLISALDPYHLSESSRCTPLLPNLHHLSLKATANDDPIDILFVQMVRRRWRQKGINSTACIRTAKLESRHRELSEVAVCAAENLRMGGMNIELRDKGGIRA
jgi:hypothetical protein